MMRLILLCLIITFALTDTNYISAQISDDTNWYFANDGSDDADGHSPATAKQTFPHMLTLNLEAGDTVFFKKGDTWRVLSDDIHGNLPWIGAENNHITFTSYGTGAKPRMLGSDTITRWTNMSGNLWYGYKTALDSFPNGRIWFHELDDTIKWGKLQTSKSSIDSPYEYLFSQDTVYIYSTSDPAIAFTSIEIPQCEEIFGLRTDQNSAEYYTFDGFEIAYTELHGISTNYPGGSPNGRTLRGLEVRNCEIHHIHYKDGPYGFGIYTTNSDVLIEKNEIHNCGRRGVSVQIDANIMTNLVENIIIQDNHFHDGFHTTGPDIMNEHNVCVLDNVIVRRNIIEDNPDLEVDYGSSGMFIAFGGSGSAAIQNVRIYNNLVINRKAKGIHAMSIDSLYIYNNTIWGVNQTLKSGNFAGILVERTTDKAIIRNNIIHSNNDSAHCMVHNTGTGYNFDYNLYYAENPTSFQNFISIHGIGSFRQIDWPIYKSVMGWDANSPQPEDPLLFDPPNDLRVYSASVATNSGIAISGYTHGFEGVAVDNPPNIGALQSEWSTFIPEELEFTKSEFLLFPDVSKRYLTVIIGSESYMDSLGIGFLTLKIIDISGSKKLEIEIHNRQRVIQIPTNLIPGVYKVQLEFGNSILVTRELILSNCYEIT